MSTLPPDPVLQDASDALPWWPREALALALCHVAGKGTALDPLPPEVTTADWLPWACARLGLRLDRQVMARAELAEALRRAAPALLWNPAGTRFLLLTGKGRATGPDGRTLRLGTGQLGTALCPPPHASLLRQGRRVAALVGGAAGLAEALYEVEGASRMVMGLWTLWRSSAEQSM